MKKKRRLRICRVCATLLGSGGCPHHTPPKRTIRVSASMADFERDLKAIEDSFRRVGERLAAIGQRLSDGTAGA